MLALGPVEVGYLWSWLGIGFFLVSLALVPLTNGTRADRSTSSSVSSVIGGAALCGLVWTQSLVIATLLVAIIGMGFGTWTPIAWGMIQEFVAGSHGGASHGDLYGGRDGNIDGRHLLFRVGHGAGRRIHQCYWNRVLYFSCWALGRHGSARVWKGMGGRTRLSLLCSRSGRPKEGRKSLLVSSARRARRRDGGYLSPLLAQGAHQEGGASALVDSCAPEARTLEIHFKRRCLGQSGRVLRPEGAQLEIKSSRSSAWRELRLK